MRDWCAYDPDLAVRRGRDWYIRVSELARRPGMTYVQALLCTSQTWVKAVDLAAASGISRRTVSYWAKTRPGFGKRIGRIWYVDLEQLGATPDQVEIIRKWAPNHRSVAKFLEFASLISHPKGGTGKVDHED